MRYTCLILLFLLGLAAAAQEADTPRFNIGDPAPALRVSHWLKGGPVREFKKGDSYVVEFWATWCKPCIAGMPHLSELAREYKGRITVVSVDVYEKKTTAMRRIQSFVDSMGQRMDYNVASEDSNFMETTWLRDFDTRDNGIPIAFVVDREERVAWIGHPQDLDSVLPQVGAGSWDRDAALAERRLNKRLYAMDLDASFELGGYLMTHDTMSEPRRSDSILAMIHAILQKEPRLKYGRTISTYTFRSLLKTDPAAAYAYGKGMLAAATYTIPLEESIYGNIQIFGDSLQLSDDLYRLGIEAYRKAIEFFPETMDVIAGYDHMAAWYWRIHDKAGAIACEQKAIATLKNGGHSRLALAGLEDRLQHYQSD
jgi:thiol-disulfide isomerase/thioredoxin